MPDSYPIITGDKVTASFLNSLVQLDEAEVTSGSAASLSLVVPPGVRSVRVEGIARSTASASRVNLEVTFNNETGSIYRRHLLSVVDTTATASFQNTTTRILPADITAANAGTGLFGSVVLVIFGVDTTRPNYQFHGGVTASTSGTEARQMVGSGQVVTAIAPLATIELSPASGQFIPRNPVHPDPGVGTSRGRGRCNRFDCRYRNRRDRHLGPTRFAGYWWA